MSQVTVKELIAELQQCKPDDFVTVSTDVSVSESDWAHRAFGEELVEVMHEEGGRVTIVMVGYLNTDLAKEW